MRGGGGVAFDLFVVERKGEGEREGEGREGGLFCLLVA